MDVKIKRDAASVPEALKIKDARAEQITDTVMKVILAAVKRKDPDASILGYILNRQDSGYSDKEMAYALYIMGRVHVILAAIPTVLEQDREATRRAYV